MRRHHEQYNGQDCVRRERIVLVRREDVVGTRGEQPIDNHPQYGGVPANVTRRRP